MLVEELREKIRKWDSRQSGDQPFADAKYSSILDQLEYHAANEWKSFIPAQHPDSNANYIERLSSWIGNTTDEEDQKLLLEYALYISFISHDDFVALYSTALNREVASWISSLIVNELNHRAGHDYHELVYREIHYHTWYCPITDSMDINEFYKVNHIQGIAHKPDFATHQMNAEHPQEPNPLIVRDLRRYMDCRNGDADNPSPPLTRLVLLEDMVGSGSQCIAAIRWAVKTLGVPVLFVPLILCPNGVNALRREEAQWGGQLTVSPVIQLSRDDLLGPERRGHHGWPISELMEELVMRYRDRASPNMNPFGYRSTGSSLATYSNTPDNTLPIVHNKSHAGNWEPLFPRVFRE